MGMKIFKTSQAKYFPGPLSSFVIHEHHATHLHYDLRLEIAGVLKSWALPRTPECKSGQKRLAVQVPDHAIDYKNFEGRIPKGFYGAGEVKIWDYGVLIPLLQKSSTECPFTPHEIWDETIYELSSGKFNFILKGRKMWGRFTLIQLNNQAKNWLLIFQSPSVSIPKIQNSRKKITSYLTRINKPNLK